MGGNQSSNPSNDRSQITQYKPRTITVKQKSQLTKADIATMKAIFDKYQEQGLLPFLQFKLHVLGNQIPDLVALAVYQMFATTKIIQLIDEVQSLNSETTESLDVGMNYQDLEIFYAVFLGQVDLDQVAYYLIKFKPGKPNFEDENERAVADLYEDITHEEFVRYIKSNLLMNMSSPELTMLYKKLDAFGFSTGPQLQITKDQFLKIFEHLKELPIFMWLYRVMDGVRAKLLNIEESDSKTSEERRLTVESIAKMRSMIQKETKLSNEELNLIKEFYDREIMGRDGKYVLKVLNKMFRQIKNKTLRQKFINSVVQKNQTSKYEYLCRLAQLICKNTDDEDDKVAFLFDIFSGFQPLMKKQAMKDFADVFQIPPTIFSNFPSQINLDDFLNVTEDATIEFDEYQVCKPMLMAMMAITPSSDLEEKEAIFAALNDNRSVENYIFDHFTDDIEKFYVCESKFWMNWCASVNFGKEESLGLKLDHKQIIENRCLLEPKHSYRLKDNLEFMNDFLLLPKFVFWPLSKWYACDLELERDVICYKATSNSRRGSIQGAIGKAEGLRSSYGSKFIMSGQKFHKRTKSEDLDSDYVKRVGELTFEIEVNPKIVYLAPINPQTGELCFRKLVQNRKVDLVHLNRVLKSSVLPFQEIQMSRLTTFQQVLNLAAKSAKQNPKKGRLHVDGVIVSGSQLLKTFEDYGLQTGTLIHYEFLNDKNNEWPFSDKNQDSARTGNDTATAQKGRITTGLKNMGNTCYMNSALQLVANLAPIHEYYVAQQQYLRQTNKVSPLGFNGKLVNGFGFLMNQMWINGKEKIVMRPRKFKNLIGKCSDQFQGQEQQDSQEFLSFLIDSLHEEQNLRLKKPQIQNPDSAGRDIGLLGLEVWSNALRRDWSFIFFLFYGQMRSSLLCKTCSTESTTFDIFSNVPLSLPEPTQMTVNVIVYRLPNKVKDILNDLIKRDQDGIYHGNQIDDGEQSLIHNSVSSAHYRNVQSIQSTRDRAQLQNFTDSYNYLLNEQPIKVQVKVESEVDFQHLLLKIAQIRDTNLDYKQVNTENIIFTLNPISNTVRQIFRPDQKLSSIDYQFADFHCVEIVTRPGREKIRQFYKSNPKFLEQKPESCLAILTQKSSRDELGPYEHRGSANNKKGNKGVEQIDTQLTNEAVNKYTYFQQIQRGLQPTRVPQDLMIVCYHRRFLKKEGRQPSFQPQILSSPFVITITSSPSGRRVYDEVWTFAQKLIKLNSKLHKPVSRWWERRDWKKCIEKSSICRPFILKTVKLNGFNCSKCHWTMKCSGCVVEPSDPPVFIDDLHTIIALAIDWHSITLTDNYNPQVSEVIEHATLHQDNEAGSLAAQNYTSLDDCLAKFHKPEILENEMRCKKCADLTPHVKKLEIFIPPPVLIIQLKRFRQTGVYWRKIQTSVDFPGRNLDLSAFVTDLRLLKEMGIESKYNLHGTINHYGNMSSGHYTSCVKNPFDKKWYLYDDDVCQEITDASIEKESAYILFYIRQDLPTKKIEEIFPSIESGMFPGRPIVTKQNQKGFVVRSKPSSLIDVKLEGSNTLETISIHDLLKEADRNEISQDENLQKGNYDESQGPDEDVSKGNKTCCCDIFPKNRNTRKVQAQKFKTAEKPMAQQSQTSNQTEKLHLQQGSTQDKSSVPLDTSILDNTVI